MSSEQLSSTIDPTLLQSLAQQHINTSAQLSGFSQLQINPDNSGFRTSYSYNDSLGTPLLQSTTMNDTNSATAPININRSQGLGAGNNQQFAGSAASFGNEYDRSGIANSFQQQLQRQQFQNQQQNFFRTHLGSSGQPEIFSPLQDEINDASPSSSYQGNHLAAMASGALPTSIPGTLLGSQRVNNANNMLRMQTFSTSPPVDSPGFQSMSLPTQSDWFDGHLVQQHSIGSALGPSSFTAQQLSSSNADMSPQNQALMSLMENEDGVVSQKSEVFSYEKRRRRRESHNAVERRRRDNINDRIQELYSLLPEAMIDANTKPNKGIILKKSVEYIRHLTQALQSQGIRIHELETGMSGQASLQNQSQATSGLAAMLAGASNMNQARSPGNDGNMMNTGL